MKTLVTGHRIHKLQQYDIPWIKEAIGDVMAHSFLSDTTYALTGMASGVDLWFGSECFIHKIPFAACIPFEGQEKTMDEESQKLRSALIDQAAEVIHCKNSVMVERADAGLVIFDGNKGGTHNVFQQLVEKNKPFVWINPVGKKIWECV